MALSKKAATRLGRLIRFMKTLPKSAERHFHMGYWFMHDNHAGHQHAMGKEVTKTSLRHCGTTACALGWAATDPYFKRLGVRLALNEDGDMTGWGKNGKEYADAVAMSAFDIDRDQYLDLFERWGSDVTTPKDWAKRASQLVKEWSKA